MYGTKFDVHYLEHEKCIWEKIGERVLFFDFLSKIIWLQKVQIRLYIRRRLHDAVFGKSILNPFSIRFPSARIGASTRRRFCYINDTTRWGFLGNYVQQSCDVGQVARFVIRFCCIHEENG